MRKKLFARWKRLLLVSLLGIGLPSGLIFGLSFFGSSTTAETAYAESNNVGVTETLYLVSSDETGFVYTTSEQPDIWYIASNITGTVADDIFTSYTETAGLYTGTIFFNRLGSPESWWRIERWDGQPLQLIVPDAFEKCHNFRSTPDLSAITRITNCAELTDTTVLYKNVDWGYPYRANALQQQGWICTWNQLTGYRDCATSPSHGMRFGFMYDGVEDSSARFVVAHDSSAELRSPSAGPVFGPFILTDTVSLSNKLFLPFAIR